MLLEQHLSLPKIRRQDQHRIQHNDQHKQCWILTCNKRPQTLSTIMCLSSPPLSCPGLICPINRFKSSHWSAKGGSSSHAHRLVFVRSFSPLKKRGCPHRRPATKSFSFRKVSLGLVAGKPEPLSAQAGVGV